MAKIIVKNADKFTEDCDLAGYREFLFGMLADIWNIGGVECCYWGNDNDGSGFITTSEPEKVLNELNTTGDWAGYKNRPEYIISE